ncbi:DEAD/DEAH box helicase [Candidatus Nanohalococcus occultus]|uniref:Superfamily II DNA and RNA helicase n=1 Tax=Candidatus Nanohalococcus occultus TaxID=2978047 RepID=A0ABY8CE29_9ARCH|nr:Superfamily II DNA and RNA helicase [Candidatus Nanohaloarchaeota archaeon SVXNc]
MTKSFEDLGISEEVVKNLEAQGITEPTTVQRISYPRVKKGYDVLVESETGSGKTLAFSLPIIEQAKGNKTQALVLTPVRELAKQVEEEISKAAGDSVNTAVIYGGVSYGPQIQDAKKANIVVGTPGRILDLLKKNKLDVSELEYFVLDEADRMLDMGFQDELEQIMRYVPENRQNLLFGATIPGSLEKMCKKYDISPKILRVKKEEHTRNLSEKYVEAKNHEKISTLYTLLKKRDRELSIVFCKTKNNTRWLSDKLRKNGIDAEALNGDMSQKQREKLVDRFEKGEVKVLVATDVAARGLDIDDVTHVFNFDVPDTADTYTHRIGRAGRQGREGEAITILEKQDHNTFRRLKRKLDIPRMKEDLELLDAQV